MDVLTAAAALVLGLAVGVLVAVGIAARRDRGQAPRAAAPAPPVAATALSRRVLEVMRLAAVVVDSSDEVVLANPAARQMGVVRAGRVVVDELRRLARAARHDGEPRNAVVDTPRGRLGREPIAVSVHVAPLVETGHVALLLEDVTEARRLEAVRRDFVGNVSHELKTPVGALSLLAEAVQDAADDPDAIRRFADRLQRESSRLGRLVAELIELSRLQGADPLPTPTIVEVDDVVAEAVDRARLAAESAGIAVVAGGERGLTVRGSESQLITALVNLVDNAVAYSPSGTRVAVGTRRRGGYVEVSVSDQGIGIAERDLERVFERFYRADPARSRATGGTGLGLAIVKHIATNHGGGVSVWSVEGSGSTFTLRLPLASSEPDEPGDDMDSIDAVGARQQPTDPAVSDSRRGAPVAAGRGAGSAAAGRGGVSGAPAGSAARPGTRALVGRGRQADARPGDRPRATVGAGDRPQADMLSGDRLRSAEHLGDHQPAAPPADDRPELRTTDERGTA